MSRQKIIFKIAYSSLFISLTIILSRFVSLPALFGLPFLKISLANTIVIFSSLYLGPVYGLIIAALSDILGALLFPIGGAFNPIYTIPAALTGLVPYFIYKFFNNLKIDKKLPISLSLILLSLSIFITCYLLTNDSFIDGKKEYFIPQYLKITIIVLSFILTTLIISITIIFKNKRKSNKINLNYNLFLIFTTTFLTYFIFKIPLSSFIKSFMLNYSFELILVTQIFIGFFACIIHSILITFCLNLSLILNKKGEVINFKKLSYNKEDIFNFINGVDYGRKEFRTN